MRAAVVVVVLAVCVRSQGVNSPDAGEQELFRRLVDASDGGALKIKDVLLANSALANRKLFEIVMQSEKSSRYDASRHLLVLLIAAEVAAFLDDIDSVAVTYRNLGDAYSKRRRVEDSIAAYLKSAEAFAHLGSKRDLVGVLGSLSMGYLLRYDYEKASKKAGEAIALHGEAVAGGNCDCDYGAALSLVVIASIDESGGRFDLALVGYVKALTLFRKAGGEGAGYGYNIAETLRAIGGAYAKGQDQVHALKFYRSAELVAGRLLYADKLADVYNNIGVLFLDQEDYQLSLRNFSESARIYSVMKDLQELARVHYNIGIVHLRLNAADEALSLLKLAWNESQESANIEVMITSGEGISAIYREQGRYAEALEELAESERLAKSIDERYRLAEIRWLRAKVYQAAGRYEEAIQEAVAGLLQAQKINAKGIAYLAYTTLGECYSAVRKDEQAQHHFRDAIRGLEESRKRVVGSEYERQLFFEQKTAAYHGMVELMMRAEKPADALVYAEKTKARTLLDVLANGKLDFRGLLTLEERREEKRLNQQIIDFNRALRSEGLKKQPELAQVNRLTEQLNGARSQLASFQSRVHSNHPELAEKEGGTEDLQLNSLREVIGAPGTAVLEYAVTEKGVYIFVITADSARNEVAIKSHYVPVARKELVKQVTQFHQSIAERTLIFTAPARELYDLLIKPVEVDLKGKRTLCIVPDEVLWNVPFQALQGVGNRYLLEDYSLYYAPSLEALKRLAVVSKSSEAESENSLLSFANPVIGERSPVRQEIAQRAGPFAPLPEAEVEAHNIRQLFPSEKSKVFVGEAATESSFKAMASGYKVIHLATHGILDDRHPLYSYVLFSDRDGEENDGMLEAREVVNLDLNADLVVLSACETGRGGIKRGEGVVGLSWAFLAAGAKTTVVSQWKVNSASTAKLMVGFYKRMRSREARATRSEALRRASLELMKDTRYRHPFYWAGFIIVGRGE